MSFDLSGILYVQREQVGNLAIAPGTTGRTINTIQDYLNKLNTTYTSKVSSSQGLLTGQTRLNTILAEENVRLANKKSKIDEEIVGRKRIVDLNESYRKKQAQYVYIIIILIFALLLYIIIIKIKTFIPVIPDSVIDLLTFFLGALTCLYLYVLVKDIYSRDNMNYDQLNLPAPSSATNEEILQKQKSAALAGDLIGSVANPNICVGESCCVSGLTKFEPGIGKCIKICPESGGDDKILYNTSNNSCESSISFNTSIYKRCGNTIIPKAQICLEGFTTLGSYTNSYTANPYSPSEFVNYSTI